MSDSASQEIIAAVGSAIVGNHCLVAALTFYACERCFTFDQEVHYIWHYRLSSVSILYMTLQVSTVVYFLLEVIQQFMTLPCDIAYPEEIVYIATAALFDMVVAIITSLRVYAVSGGSRTVSIVVFGLSLVGVGYDIFEAATLVAVAVPPPIGCAIGPASFHSIRIATLLGQMTRTIADAIVLLMTWRGTYNMVQLARRGNVAAPKLAMILLRDGSIYFVLLTAMSIINTVFYMTTTFNGVELLILSLTSVILSRFFLNLRKASVLAAKNSDPLCTTSSTSLGIGSLGGSIAFAGAGDSEEDAEPALDDDGDDIPENEFRDKGGQIDASEGISRHSTEVTSTSRVMPITSDV